MRVNVALAQVAPVTNDKRANIAKFVDYMDRAAREGAQLVVFPELALTGYGCSDCFFEVAEPVPGPSTERLAEEARKRHLHLIWGMPERGLPGVVYNSAVLVGPEGHVGTWRKHTLPGHATDLAGPGAFPDRRFFRVGNRSPVFDTPIGRIGMMVCYDVFFPEISRLLVLKGADLLVGISGSPAFEQRIFEPLGKARAMEIVLTGRPITAREAHAAGLVTKVVPVEVFFEEALALAREIAAKPPIAVQMAKDAVLKSFDLPIEAGLDYERKNFVLLFATEDMREGTAAFVEKRKPEFKGR